MTDKIQRLLDVVTRIEQHLNESAFHRVASGDKFHEELEAALEALGTGEETA